MVDFLPGDSGDFNVRAEVPRVFSRTFTQQSIDNRNISSLPSTKFKTFVLESTACLCHKNGSFGVHDFNEHYLSISAYTSHRGNRLFEADVRIQLTQSLLGFCEWSTFWAEPAQAQSKHKCGPLQVGQLIMYYTPRKGITICLVFNLPGLQKPGRNHFPKILAEWLKIGFLVSQNNLWTYSLIRVQGDCPFIFFLLLVSYFNVMVICYTFGKLFLTGFFFINASSISWKLARYMRFIYKRLTIYLKQLTIY